MDVLTGNQSIAFSCNKNLMKTKVASLVLIRTVPVIETQGEWEWKEVAEESNYAEILSSIQKAGYEAIEVLFHLCVQSYDIRVDKGKQTTTVANSTLTPIPGLENYGATYEAIQVIGTEMKALLMTYAQERPVQSEERPEDIYLDLLFDSISRSLWTSIFLEPENLLDPGRATDRIKKIFMNFAIGLSRG
ncbi:hypothetical protein QC763_0027560 [Podospora pseudopauciseta]|uniref:Uncharacterized protein n=1 Tax=Podospora pseudopauciseta TaxID=2093780 RepID=A0ABR0I3P2_9PEZI|nr:hypothetical protein QC763_0027560 [Podospora pseudopauciseta]